MTVYAAWLIAGSNVLRFLQQVFCPKILYFFHVLFDCNLFEINISYGFGDTMAARRAVTFSSTGRRTQCAGHADVNAMGGVEGGASSRAQCRRVCERMSYFDYDFLPRKCYHFIKQFSG